MNLNNISKANRLVQSFGATLNIQTDSLEETVAALQEIHKLEQRINEAKGKLADQYKVMST